MLSQSYKPPKIEPTALEFAARCACARQCERDYARVRLLRGGDGPGQRSDTGTSSNPSAAAPSGRRAWLTLLTNASYANGVKALHNSLEMADSDYPLVVLVTPGVPGKVRDELAAHGCSLLPVEAMALPAGPGNRIAAYAMEHFAECWTKLRLWELEQFERVVYLDADMIVLKNMDELFEDTEAEVGGGGPSQVPRVCRVKAVHECFCAVRRGDAACAHFHPTLLSEPPAGSYFNAGLLVLDPSRAVFEHMAGALASVNLSACPFGDQDFLNGYFCGAWTPLPWTYNATKTLYACHRANANGCRDGVWQLQLVRNLHFTMAKPWNLKDPKHQGFERLNKLWWAAFAEPQSLNRVLLQVHLQEKRALANAAA